MHRAVNSQSSQLGALRMMLYIHGPRHSSCLGARADVRTPSIRPRRSMLMLAVIRYAPGTSGLLLPALSAASTSCATWRTLRSSTSSSSARSCCITQQQQLSVCCGNSCGSTSNSAQGSIPLSAARLQLLQPSAHGTTHNRMLPAAARTLTVAAAATGVQSDTGSSSSSRRRRSRRSAAPAAATAVLAPPSTAAASDALLLPHTPQEIGSPPSASDTDEARALSGLSEAAAEPAAAAAPGRRRRTIKAAAAAAAAFIPKRGIRKIKAAAKAEEPPPVAAVQQPAVADAPAAARRSRHPKATAAAAAQVQPALEAAATAAAAAAPAAQVQPALEAAEPTTARRRGSRQTEAAAAAAEPEQRPATEVLQQAQLLQEQLKEYCAAYYNGQPLIADDVYDAQLTHFKAVLQQLRTSGASAEAQQLEQNSPITRVGAPVPAVTQLKKVRHPSLMTSLAAMRDKDEILSWASRLHKAGLVDPNTVSWAVEPKVDGMALRVVYRSGKLVLAATRGDGAEGEDITHNMLTGSCQGLPVTLKAPRNSNLPEEFEVRGELYMNSRDFEALNEEELQAGRDGFANPRNVAAGSARLLDPQEFARRRLSFMAYQLMLPEGTPDAPTTQSGSLDWMKRLAINTTASSSKQKLAVTYEGFEAAVTAAEAWMESRNALDYEVDGAVLKIDDLQIQQALGSNGAKDPKWAVAWKFPAKEVTTILRGIEWSVGKTGAVTPVALLEPVECGGVTVSRASLHNLGQLRALDLRISDTVTLKRAGDVIPQLIGALREARGRSSAPVQVPTKCPSCTRKLETHQAVTRGAGDQLFCVNPSCPAQQLAKVKDFASVCMTEVGPATVEELWNRGLLASPSGFYKLTKEDLLQLPKTKDKKATKVLDAIQTSKQMSLTTLIQGLGIPSVGKQSAENLAKKYKTMKALQLWSSRSNGHGHDGSRRSSNSTSSSELTGEKGVLGDSLEAWFTHAHNKLLLNELRELGITAVQEDEQAHETAELQLEHKATDPRLAPRVEPGGLTPGVSDVNPLEGLSVCVTGTLTSQRYGPTREAAKQFIETRGGEFHLQLRRSTQYLVKANKKPGENKLKQARAWDIPILTEQEFNALIEERILQLQGYLDFDLD